MTTALSKTTTAMVCNILGVLSLLLLVALETTFVQAFQATPPAALLFPHGPKLLPTTTTAPYSADRSPTTVLFSSTLDVEKLRAEAQRIRREANDMDEALTLQKMESIQDKLNNKVWLEKNPDQAALLEEQLVQSKNRRSSASLSATDSKKTSTAGVITKSKEEEPPANTSSDSITIDNFLEGDDDDDDEEEEEEEDVYMNAKASFAVTASMTNGRTSATKKSKNDDNNDMNKDNRYDDNPLSGYEEADLELYLPVVTAIEERMPLAPEGNATLQDQLDAFRAAPELQDHFQSKIQELLVEPMQDMQRLEKLRHDYLGSSSSVERKQLKREIEQLERTVEEEGPFMYSDSIVLEDLPKLEEDEIQQRIEAVSALPKILQALYKKRCGVNETSDLRLAIEMDHYEPQIQLLEQVGNIEPLDDEVRHEIRIALLSLPPSVRYQFASNLGVENGSDEDDDNNDIITEMIQALVDDKDREQWMSLTQVFKGATSAGGSSFDVLDENDNKITMNFPEYSDLDFLDRSSHVKEFIPSLTRLELVHPPIEDIDTLMKEVIDKKAFMVTSKPERVLGGYYIYGRNLLADETGSNSDKLVSRLQDRLQKSSLAKRIDLFYIQDPAPPTDEEYELELTDRPVLVVTAKNRQELYNLQSPVLKTAISGLGLACVLLFAAATTEMQPMMRDQLEAAAAGDTSIDLSPIASGIVQGASSILAIQLTHELFHRIVAWRDKVSCYYDNIGGLP